MNEGVLITGANGHLGRRLIRRLAGQRPVRAVVRSRRAREQLAAHSDAGECEVEILDYADVGALTRAARGCRHVVHLVGIIKESGNSSYTAAHEDTTRALVAVARSVPLQRIVYLSIIGSHADARNPCLASKGRAEDILLAGPVPALILRVPMVLGEGDFASRALARRARARFAWTFRGQSLEQPIYAGDVVEAIVAGLENPDLDDVTINLAGPESLSRNALTTRAGRAVGGKPVTLSLPLGLGMAMARALGIVSANPPVTAAMLGVLDHDDAIDPLPACERLGIRLTPLDEMLRMCLASE